MQATEHRAKLHMAPSSETPAAPAQSQGAPRQAPKPEPPRPKTELDNIFGPGDIYRGPKETALVQPVPPKPPAEPVSSADSSPADPPAKPGESTTAPLLDGGEIEDALKLFDEVDD